MINSSENTQDFLLNHTISSFINMRICKKEDIICKDFRIIPYGNVIFIHDIEKYRDKVLGMSKAKGFSLVEDLTSGIIYGAIKAF